MPHCRSSYFELRAAVSSGLKTVDVVFYLINVSLGAQSVSEASYSLLRTIDGEGSSIFNAARVRLAIDRFKAADGHALRL